MAVSGDVKPDIVLNSPVGADPAIYKWPLTYVSKGQKIDGAEEIVETIRWVGREFPELKPAIENLVPGRPDSKSYDCIKTLCDKYNKILETVLKMNKGTSVAPKTSSRASQSLLKHIIQQVYNFAVADPTELNRYSPFSSETYGETNFDFMAQLIEKNQFRPREQDIFIDLGSGVGHLVLQMAASVDCKKCYGIEISDVPAGFAKVMEERFRFWMDWHGKTYSDFELHHGDFFDKRYVDFIKNAAYIFVNNYAFKPEVDHKLKQMFLDLKDGVQILSSKPFCSPKARVTERHLTDIGSIMQVSEIKPELKKDSVSWTPKPVPYYLHVLDASPVEKYYERKKRRQGRSADRGRPNKRRKGAKGADSSDESDDNVVYGPTTRKAWSEWCNSTSASNRASADSVKSSRNNSTDTENYESAIENDESKAVVAKPKETDQPRTREKRIQETQTPANEKQATSQGTSAQTKASQASQAAKSCLDKKRDYASKKTTPDVTPKEKSYSCLTKTAPEVTNGSSPSKVPPLVIKVTPPVETKATEESAKAEGSTRSENLKQDAKVKVNDENGKQLRQRKRPTAAAQNNAAQTTAPSPTKRVASKAGSKASQPTNASSSNATTNAEPRVSKRAAQTAAKSTPKQPTAASKKRTTSSDKNSCLDLLHAKTIESVSGQAGYFPQPAPGCKDHSLRSIVATPSLPNVVIKDTQEFINDLRSKKTLDKVMEGLRGCIETFAQKLEKSEVRDSLRREIDKERQTKILLSVKEQELMREIRALNDRVFRVMKKHTDELDAQSNIKSVIQSILFQLKKNQDLRWNVLELESSISSQRNINPLPLPAHANSSQSLTSPYHRSSAASATLDLSLKQGS